jgi:hypothetical protein
MTDPDLIGLFITPLESLKISYMITGGVASVIYGDPRFTRDIDVVLELRGSEIDGLISAFSSEDYYVPPLEALREEVHRPRHGHFTLIHRDTALRADVYLLGDDPLHAWAFGRRLRIPLDEISIWLAPIEYVILRKLEYFQRSGSDRHLRDVAMMLEISGQQVDRVELDRWVEHLGLHEAWLAAGAFGR